jgi:hypothetical protein
MRPGQYVPPLSQTGRASKERDIYSDTGFARFEQLRITGVAGAIAEPSTWAMMLIGFGLLGAAMRRKKKNIKRTARLRSACLPLTACYKGEGHFAHLFGQAAGAIRVPKRSHHPRSDSWRTRARAG